MAKRIAGFMIPLNFTTKMWGFGLGSIYNPIGSHDVNEVVNMRAEICVLAFALGHFKNTEVLIFGAALGFSHYLVHLMSIGTILSEINQYLDLPHRL